MALMVRERRRELWQGLVCCVLWPARGRGEPEGEEREVEHEVEREVRAQGEGEGRGVAMSVDEADNEDTGADAEDEEMASPQEEQHDGVVRERIPERFPPVASAPASTSITPTGTNPPTTKIKSKRRKGPALYT